MIRMQHPWLFLLLLLPLLLGILFGLYLLARRRKLNRFAQHRMIQELAPELSSFKPWMKYILASLAICLLVLAAVNPQLGNKSETVKRKGVDIMIAFDVSNSMLCQDVPPSRLIRAKQFVSDFIDQLQNDRIGLIVFAGNAYIQMPLTVDYSAARMYLRDIDPSQIPSQGTDISGAVDMALKCFPKESKDGKALIIITDGEDNGDGAVMAIRKARQEGVVTHMIGVGSVNGGPIPLASENGTYKTDADGNIVRTKLNVGMVKQLAAEGNGQAYVLDDPKSVIRSLDKDLNKMNQKSVQERVFTDYENYFQWFLIPAILLLALEFLFSDRRSRWMDWLNPFKSDRQ